MSKGIKAMKCPLIRATTYTTFDQIESKSGDCLGGECAWWESTMGKCSVRRIWIALQDIHEALHDIRKSMPKDLAPRG